LLNVCVLPGSRQIGKVNITMAALQCLDHLKRVKSSACYKVGLAHGMLRPGFCAQIYQDGAAASALASLNIVENVSHKPRMGQIEVVFVGRLQKEARTGLAALTWPGQFRHHSLGMMWTGINACQLDTEQLELGPQMGVHTLQVSYGEIAHSQA
jgi:hypothetical protein